MTALCTFLYGCRLKSDVGLHRNQVPYGPVVANERLFTIGERVRWVRAVSGPEYRNVIGMVVAVIPDDRNSRQFSMYDVQFSFGLRTLYGTQIEAVEGIP
jgi:hypothetical protein